MNKEVYQVMPAGLRSEHLNVQHMGQPGNRMPVAGLVGGKRPDDTLDRQAVLYVGIFTDIFIVIVVNKFIVLYLPVDGKG